MNRKIFLFINAAMFLSASIVFGQNNPDADYENRRSEMNRQNDDYNRQHSSQQRNAGQTQIVVLSEPGFSPELSAQMKIALAPNKEDLTQYQVFLRQPKTGLFRLLPNLDCNQMRVVRVGGECENALPIGEFYSFRRKSYSDMKFSDITFKDGSLIGKSQLAQTILVKLGDVALENVSLDSDGVKYLSEFVPQTENTAVKAQYDEIKKGIEANNFRYAKSEKAFLNKTYALRVVAYRFDEKTLERIVKSGATSDHIRLVFNNYDRRDDLIVAFRIVRQDTDGGLSILWKELSRRAAPTITFKKKEPLVDFNQ